MENSFIQQPAIRFEIPRVPTPTTETTDGFDELREWQKRCFKKLSGRRNWIITAPPAAGKSVQICAVATDRLRRDNDLKVIIAVPQTIIAAGFRANRIVLPDATRVEWAIQSGHDLCKERPQQSAEHLLRFLSARKSHDMMSRVILCTHSTLVRAFAKDKTAFINILLVIDEAHHTKHSECEDSDIEVDNRLGALVKHSLLHPTKIQLGLTTATFFRGDRGSIVPDISQFTCFDFPVDKYLETCTHLHGFSYDFLTHSASFVEPLKHLFVQTIGKTIVYIPPVGSSCSLGTKAEDVDAVLKAIAGTETYIVVDQDQPIMRLKRGDEWVKVVNLVDERLREEKKEGIISAHKQLHPNDIDVIIALGLFKEGANWRWANREITIGQRGSLTELCQMVGRLLRDAPGKRHVEVYQLLPFVFDQADRAQMRRSLNEYFSAILLSMLLESVMSPLAPPVGKRKLTPDEGEQRVNYLREACADDSKAAMVLEEIRSLVFDTFADGSSLGAAYSRREALGHIVKDVLTAHGVDDYHDEIADQIFQMTNRRSATLGRLNVGAVDVDLISENPFACFLQYASEACGIKTFQELRTRMSDVAPFQSARAWARSLNLKSRYEWFKYSASGRRPHDIPSNPNKAYKGKGWIGYRDWLGTDRNIRSFQSARQFVHGLQLKSQKEWYRYCRSGQRPWDIPPNPHSVYKDKGWIGLGDWLGTGTVAPFNRTFRPFIEAREFVRALCLKSQEDWTLYRRSGKRPADIPTNPHNVYKDQGWVGLGDWLGTGTVASVNRVFRRFIEAREFVHTLELKSQGEWFAYCKSGKKPDDIPWTPGKTYKNEGWKGLRDWLGTPKSGWHTHPFLDAREFVRSLGLQAQMD